VTVKIEADTADAVSAVDSMVEGMEAKRVVIPVVGGESSEQLFGAYGKAYATYADPKYKDAYDAAAAAYQKMASEVASTADEQAKAKEAAKALAAAEKRLADAQEKLAAAEASGNLKDIQTARKAVTEATTDLSKLDGANTKVVYTVEVSGDELKTLQQKLQALGDETIKVNVEPGDVEMPKVLTDDETVTVKIEADTADAVSAVDSMVEGMEAKRVVIPVVGGESSEQLLNVKFTDSNMSAFVKGMKDELANAELGSALYNSLTSQIADATMLGNLMQQAIKNGIDVAQFNPQELWSKVFSDNPGDYISDDQWQGLFDKINEARKAAGLDAIVINFKTGDVKSQAKEMSKDWKEAASAIQSVGSAMSQIEDPAAKIVGTIGQAIATMALSYAEASKQAAMNPANAGWGWIAFAATGLATMISSIAAIHSATGYAEGGVIQGNSYSGDNQWARVNAGEVILNRAQVGNLAAQLEGASGQGVTAQPYVNGEQIWLGLSNYLRRSGRGEVVTSRR